MGYVKRILGLLLLVALLSCGKKKNRTNELQSVTYHISTRFLQQPRFLVIYKDSTDLVAFYCQDKEWSKEVLLPLGERSFVSASHATDQKPGSLSYQLKVNPGNDKKKSRLISVQITHKQKTAFDAGSNSAEVALFLHEDYPD